MKSDVSLPHSDTHMNSVKAHKNPHLIRDYIIVHHCQSYSSLYKVGLAPVQKGNDLAHRTRGSNYCSSP